MINQEAQQYRRGTILGLTMAEAVILVVFCLLLVLHQIVANKNQTIAEQSQQLIEQKQMLVELSKDSLIVERIAQLGFKSFDDAFQELHLLQIENNKLKEKVAEFNENKVLVEVVENLIHQNPEISLEELSESVKLAETIKEMVVDPDMDVNSENILDMITRLKKEKDNARGQLVQLQKRMEKLGNGMEMPACWATPEGKPEYIFQVVLTSGGIIVHDNALEHRRDEQVYLPIDDTFQFDQELSSLLFQQLTAPLFNWSTENECRFYVKVYDDTGSTEKIAYKKHLRAVEGHFYIYESKDSTPGWNVRSLVSPLSLNHP